jgi:hypothetical protein
MRANGFDPNKKKAKKSVSKKGKLSVSKREAKH